MSKETTLEKLNRTEPYNIFFNLIPEIPCNGNCVEFSDLLCPSLGQLKCSLQFTFLLTVEWLMDQYEVHNVHKKPLTILFGSIEDPETFTLHRNITYERVKIPNATGIHHSKIGIYVYEDDSLRVVTSSANLYAPDWEIYHNGLWVSPLCPRLPDSHSNTEGESPTGFKSALLQYLQDYNVECLTTWLEQVKRADFSAVKVFLITSVPGLRYPHRPGSHIYTLKDILKEHADVPFKWPVVAQASSMGFMGASSSAWLRGTMMDCFASCQRYNTKLPDIHVIYPSMENVNNCYFVGGGSCLGYQNTFNVKQMWLAAYLHHWSADKLNRSNIMPHIKTFCRISPDNTKLGWFLLTSANLSRASWGSPNLRNNNQGVYVKNYEAGVLFIPKFFNEVDFHISKDKPRKNEFPLMYDLPLSPYGDNDQPWVTRNLP